MDQQLVVLIVAVLAVTAVWFVLYRLKQASRVRAVKECVRSHLRKFYGERPHDLNFNCSDDYRWPILVSFAEPRSGVTKRLQFMCGETVATFRVLA
jgi:hypothetical protein